MIRVKNHKQGDLFDGWAHLGPKRRKLLDNSWAGFFREHILEQLPVEELTPFFKESMGRPTKELYTVMGAVLLQQAHDLTDDETIEQLAFNYQWHYALNITDDSDEATYICPKTLYNVHRLFMEHNIDWAVFDSVTSKLAEVFEVETGKQRLDSVHIKSNMARLGRLGLMVKTISRFLVNLKRQRRELFDGVEASLSGKYMGRKALGCFSMVKPSDSSRVLSQVAGDLFDLCSRFSGNESVLGMSSFQLLLRVLHEQCLVTTSASGEPLEYRLLPSAEVSCRSLQNPSDPEAGYDSQKGQGYQVQVMETYSEARDPEQKARTLDLITYVWVESASAHDAHALIPALESASERGIGPDEVLADSSYGGDDNIAAARDREVEVVSPAMKGSNKEGGLGLVDFEFSEEGETLGCPAGHAPVSRKSNRKKGRHSVGFDLKKCSACPLADDCPARPGKKCRYLRYNNKQARIARRRAAERRPEFKDRYRMRAGIEATFSTLDRLTNIKRLRVRGLNAVRCCATLKATGMNIFRALAVRAARKDPDPASVTKVSGILHPFHVFKELFRLIYQKSIKVAFPHSTNFHIESQMAF